MSLTISYFTRHFNVELKILPDIRPDIRYGIRLLDWPGIRLAGCPAKSVSGAFLFKTLFNSSFN
jgi:hypothetical protein